MGLLDELTTQGSPLTPYNGSTPGTNPLATDASKLHAFNNLPGYSIDGAFTADVNASFQSYDDGVINQLPQPSGLDLNGQKPSNNYRDNAPEGKTF